MKYLLRAGWVVAAAGLAVGLAVLSIACNSKQSTGEAVPVAATGPKPGDEAEAYDGPAWFEDVTAQSGIDFTYKNGYEADHMAIIESLGGGIALLDYDHDGLMDVFIAGGGYYDGKKVLGHPGRLYKNLGGFKFKDVTAEVGLNVPCAYSHGLAVADVNRDGWPDLLVTGYNRLTLFINTDDGKGGRKFVDVTEKAGLTERLWSSGAAFVDLDGDGYPDLYVCHYGDWGFDTNHPTFCTYDGKTRDVCAPRKFTPLQHHLYRNNGNGTFTDITTTVEIGKEKNGTPIRGLRKDGKGLGVLAVDINADGRPDLYIANDTDDNFLYVNRTVPGGPIILEEVGGLSGVARDNRATPNGSMGLDAGDPSRTGRPALFVTNYEGELHALYTNQTTREPVSPAAPTGDNIVFDFESHKNGIVDLGPLMVGWGTAFCDFDRDGWEDLFIAHGHAVMFPSSGAGRQQLAKLLMNEKGKFKRISARGGPYFKTRHNSRGIALGDLDNDGKPDLIISHLNEPVTVLKNTVPTQFNWVGFGLMGEKFRDITGGKLVVEAGGETFTRFLKAGGTYAGSNDPRVNVGIAAATTIDKVTVYWPNGGKAQEWKNLAANRYWKLTEGDATAK